MKKFFKIFGIIAIVAIIGFSIVGCFLVDDPDDDGSSGNGSGIGNGSGSKTPGSTQENAIPVAVGYSSSHNISSSGEQWFKFVGTGNPVIFETKGNVVDTFIAVFEGDARITWDTDDNSGAGYNALYAINTTSGTTYSIY